MKILSKTKWQDRVFSLGEVVFLVGLLPSVFGSHKPAAITSLVTALMLYGFLAVHWSYKLWMTLTLTLITASFWLTLFFQAA